MHMASQSVRQITRSTGTVMFAFLLSNLMGLLRQILITHAFGTSPELDAFNAANRVGETLFTLIAGGALGSAFIPVYTSLLTHEKRSEAWRLASAIANLLLVVLTILSLLAAIFAPQIVRYLLASGFVENPAQEALTIELMRLILPSAVLFGLSGLVMGILNSHQVFFVPAITPAMYQFGLIFGVVALKHIGIHGLAWGVLIGATLHLLLQIPSLLKLGGVYFPTLGIKLANVRQVILLMGPRLLGQAVVQLNFWVNTNLASRQEPGSVTGITLGFALMMMPQAAIAQSTATAAMPTLSRQYASGRLDDFRLSLATSLRNMLLLAIPASLGLVVLCTPVVAALYQRGQFTTRSTELVAWALLWYAAGLVGHCVVEVLARAFYAMHDTKTPVFVGVGAMGLNILFSFMFSALFEQSGWLPLGGLALANSLATALESIVLLTLIRSRLAGLQGRTLATGTGKALLSTIIMTAGLIGWLRLSAAWPDWLRAGGGTVLGGSLYALGLFALRTPELFSLYEALKRRIQAGSIQKKR